MALAVRAEGAGAIRHSFGWLLKHAGPEWVQLYLHTIHEGAVRRGHVAILAQLLAAEPRMKSLLKGLAAGG